ncbi:hypothetical protein BS47DRAFT_1363973 [Hydnum rufescens UP504]|uniref:Uncharacterized protein n=1 Tax=Hydnum rufescens UP504 TaxID=1448309 RepID=A0A9P6ASW3_9AGAM|nr:hypothetical protein BS47DRAFT_1363973 [Hydnum rufescens UP504]
MKTHLTSTRASPQYAQPPKQRGPAPRTRQLTKPRTTHLLQQALSQRENPRTTQPDPRTHDHGAKNEYHTPALAGVCLSSGPNTRDPTERTQENNNPPAKQITRMAMSRNHDASPGQTPHPPKRVWYSSEPASPNRSHDPAEGNPNGEARNDVPGTTHLPKQYHTPARAGVWCY